MQRIFVFIFMLLLSIFSVACGAMEPTESVDTFHFEDLEHTTYFREGALEHILIGEINHRGQAVGYHYEGLANSKGRIIPGTVSPVNGHGVYTAKVIVGDVEKISNGGRSTFFPKEWTPQMVVDAVNMAYEHKMFLSGNTYAGLTEEGMEIRMYLDEKEQIISAFPVY